MTLDLQGCGMLWCCVLGCSTLPEKLFNLSKLKLKEDSQVPNSGDDATITYAR